MSYVGRVRDLSLDESIKNMKQIFYYAFIILLFMSCNQESVVKEAPIRYVKPGKTVSVEKDPAFAPDFEQTLTCTDVEIFNDSVMLLYDMIGTNKNICFFKAYSLDDYSYKGEYITYGRGPDELLAPALSGTIRSGKDGTDCGYIYDGMLGKSFCFDINRSIKENETILQELTKLPANTIYAFPYLDSLQFIMNIENDRVLYHILDTQSNAIDTFDMFRDDISAENCISGLANCVEINNDKGMAAMLMLAIPQINFLNLQDGKVKSVAVSKQYKNWKNILYTGNDMNSLMNSMRYYIDAASTRDHILSIYTNNTIGQSINGGGQAPHIHIFDWEGNFLYDLAVKENISRIDYDSQRKHLYGLDVNEGKIYRYDMSGILD